MVTVALILALAVLVLTWVVASLSIRLRLTRDAADLNADLANAYLSQLVKAGVVQLVDTCQRTQGSKR